MLPDGRPAAESVYGAAQLTQESDYTEPRRKRTVAKEGDYFSLVVNWSAAGNYYHWMHDTLTRLYGVGDFLPPQTKYVVPADLRPFQEDSLRALGIGEDRMARFDGTEVWELETLHFAPPVTNSGSDLRAADVWTRDQIMAHYDIVPSRSGRRIFISREHAPRRRLANQAEVEPILDRFGFETVAAERLTFRQQVELFSGAEAVVAIHGAGFTNMLFSPPGLVVLDMIEPSRLTHAFVFWTMAEELGHDYWYVVTGTAPRPGRQSDAVITPESLQATLEQLPLGPKR